jgi:methylated-DNA-[protein]-cysteine S-methyltransferase
MNVFTIYKSAQLGNITIQACDDGLSGVWLEQQTTQPDNLGVYSDDHPVLKQTIEQLKEYLANQRRHFSVTLAATGTDFQKKVWQALTEIPFGEVCSYQELANAIDNPKAVRAVGMANGKNPISIIVPCHRVIGKNGTLTGYAGGVERKQWLLEHESEGG